jgi:uncharacterized membrane protein YozB (DUF420 family)
MFDSRIFPAAAPALANFTFVTELAMGVGLVLGAWAARVRRYELHACCQSSIVLLNLVVVALAMTPSFTEHVAPRIPQRLGRPFYLMATAHGVLGGASEILALYVLIAAGTTWLPEQLRLRNFKRVMRVLLVMWWVALVLGIATYVQWYVPGGVRLPRRL